MIDDIIIRSAPRRVDRSELYRRYGAIFTRRLSRYEAAQSRTPASFLTRSDSPCSFGFLLALWAGTWQERRIESNERKVCAIRIGDEAINVKRNTKRERKRKGRQS